ncbi:hypothetical protein [Halobellus ruber]|uniref:Uncharacterized protein n=1 Tax=Halobellus ruber TaxID=2761102 RepID=A0A7J9SNA0_9EURY|nr:hypothetical protein [Halobellus ruber]MBB6647983.1 hypothetical protein [Halobellus ruber]
MRIADTEDRDRLWEMLVECSNQSTKSKAVEDAARYYCRMRGARGYNSAVKELLQKADEQGGVTAHEIAEILDARELPVEYETSIEIGEK